MPYCTLLKDLGSQKSCSKDIFLTFLPKFSGEGLGSTWSSAKMTQILIKGELQSPEHQLRGRDPGLSHQELWLDPIFPPKAEAPSVGDGGVQK